MTERDLQQKLDMRRAFWALGASTRINVKLGALLSRSSGRQEIAAEEWTDLDVLAVDYVPLVGLTTAVADCKTTKTRSAERVFWLKGVSDLFEARAAYMVRDTDLISNARQLALKLGIAAMDAEDRTRFLDLAGTARLPAVGSFLSVGAIEQFDSLMAATPDTLSKLQRYRRAFYWVLPRHRNLVQLPSYLSEVAGSFVATQRWALALIADLAWLYLLTVAHTVDEITKVHLSSFTTSLRQSLVGGELEMREKQLLAEQLRTLVAALDKEGVRGLQTINVLPPYFDDLVDLASRTSQRRTLITEALRALEFISVESAANGGAAWSAAFPSVDPRAAKLASDVVRFLCRATRVDPRLGEWFDKSIDSSVTGSELPHLPAAAAPPQGAGQPQLFDPAKARPRRATKG